MSSNTKRDTARYTDRQRLEQLEDALILKFTKTSVGFDPILSYYPPSTRYFPQKCMVCTRIPCPSEEDGTTQCFIPCELKEHLFAIPGFPRTPPLLVNKEYSIAATVSKGLGMFTTSAIDIGELIVAERPLLIVPDDPLYRIAFMTVPPPVDLASKWDLFTAVINLVFGRMSEENRAAYVNRANTKPGNGVLLGIFQTNIQAVELNPGNVSQYPNIKYSAVFKTVSRVNHSCCPNAAHYFDTQSFSSYLRAVRPISQGEKICISYTEPESIAAQRFAVLHEYSIPRCTCPCCFGPTVPVSDLFRTSIRVRASHLYSQYIHARDSIIQSMSRRVPANLIFHNFNVRHVYDIANTLVRQMGEMGLESSMWYPKAMSVYASSAVLLASSHVREIELDVNALMKKHEKVLLGHEGEHGEEYSKVVLQNRMWGVY